MSRIATSVADRAGSPGFNGVRPGDVTSTWPYAVVGFGSLLLLWQLLHSFHAFSETLLPRPMDALMRLWELVVTRDIMPDLWATLWRTLAGFALAGTLGIAVGMLVGSFRALNRIFIAPLDFFRSLPVTTLYPLFILFFGLGNANKIAMVFVASWFVVILNTAYGVLQASPIRRQMAELFGASRLQVLMHVTFHDALPQIMIGLRVALSYSLIVSIVCEMFMGTQRGLGQRVFDAYNTYSISELYALVLIVGAIGYLLNVLFVFVERRTVHWGRR